MSSQWLLNAGLFAGHNSDTGGYASPRLMVNYHWRPEHTLRFGVSAAQRAPTLFQKRSNVRYFVPGLNIYIPTFVSSGTVRPEQLETTEISYYGRFPDAQITLDVRAYEERFTDEIKARVVGPGSIRDFQNLSGSTSRGLEYQVKWSPVPETQLIWNHAVTRLTRPAGTLFERMPPDSLYSLGWMQQLPDRWDVSLWWHARSAMTWRGVTSQLGSASRVDVRLAKQFRWGKNRAEAAVTVQAINGDQIEFTSRERSVFERRAFATLRVEF
jgi:iron complex outermembrane receptor protein